MKNNILHKRMQDKVDIVNTFILDRGNPRFPLKPLPALREV
jgi:hypothetical protein